MCDGTALEFGCSGPISPARHPRKRPAPPNLRGHPCLDFGQPSASRIHPTIGPPLSPRAEVTGHCPRCSWSLWDTPLPVRSALNLSPNPSLHFFRGGDARLGILDLGPGRLRPCLLLVAVSTPTLQSSHSASPPTTSYAWPLGRRVHFVARSSPPPLHPRLSQTIRLSHLISSHLPPPLLESSPAPTALRGCPLLRPLHPRPSNLSNPDPSLLPHQAKRNARHTQALHPWRPPSSRSCLCASLHCGCGGAYSLLRGSPPTGSTSACPWHSSPSPVAALSHPTPIESAASASDTL